MEHIMALLSNPSLSKKARDFSCEIDGNSFDYEVTKDYFDTADCGRIYICYATKVNLLAVNSQPPTEEVKAKFQELIDNGQIFIDLMPEPDMNERR